MIKYGLAEGKEMPFKSRIRTHVAISNVLGKVHF